MTRTAGTRQWYDMTRPTASAAGTPSEATIRIYGDIGDSFWFWDPAATSANDFVEDLDELGEVQTIHIRLNSPGGDFADGITIMNALREHAAEVVVHVDGLAASAASLIAMAGDKIIMGRGAQMMVHDASMGCWGTAAELEQTAQACNSISGSMAAIYAERAGGTPASWRTAMASESWYGPDEAVAAGLADTTSVEDAPPPTPPVEDEDEEVEEQEEGLGDEDDLTPRRVARTMRKSRVAAHFRYKGRAEAPAPIMPTARAAAAEERSEAVAFSDEQLATMRSSLGLADDADEAAIVAALAAPPAQDEGGDAPAASSSMRATAQLPPGARIVDEATLATLQEDAAAGRAAREEQIQARRAGVIRAAVRDGKIAPARAAHWRTLLDNDEEGTTQVLASLERGLLPIEPRGYDGGGATTEDEKGTADTIEAALADPVMSNWKIAGAPGFSPFAVRSERSGS